MKNKFKQTEIGLIPEGWEIFKLEQTGKIITGKTPSSKDPECFGAGLLFVTPTDFKNFTKTIYSTERTISDFGKNLLSNFILPKDSILVTCIGSDMGKVAINKNECVTNQQINSIILNKKFDYSFLYYLLINNYSLLRGLATSGSTMPIVNKSEFGNIKLAFPKIEEQQSIASVLSSFDDKIELLEKQNETLEKIGEALFKHWFIDFEFPNEKGKPYKSNGGKMIWSGELQKEIPEGWEVQKIENLITRNRRLIKNYNNWKDKDLIDLSNMPQFSMAILSFDKGEKFKSNIFELNEYDILFGSIRPYFGKYGFSPINGVITGTIYSLKPKDENYYSFILSLICRKEFVEYAVRLSRGTKMPIINWKDFSNFEVSLPQNKELIVKFNDIVLQNVICLKNNIHQIRSLQKTRNLLLPKLISGKIRVN